MIYLKKDNEIQTAFIPKNGSYEGKKTYKEGYKEGYIDGMEEGKNNPYTTKGVFVENGLQKHIAWGFNVERNYPVSWMDDNNILEISFYPLQEGGLITSDRAYFDFVLEGGKLIARVDDFEVSVVCELFKWHTLKMQGNGFWLDKKYYEYPKSTSYQGTMHIGRSWRDGRYYKGYISYIYATEDEGVEMYYYCDKNDGTIKRLNKRNGIWKHENQMWGNFPLIEDTPPMESVMISVPQEGGNCPELTVLDVDSNGRYEGAYSVVNVNVPDVNGSYDEGYNNGYNDGLNAGSGSCNIEETRWAEPTPADVDGSGYLVYYKSEGYDGMDRVALNMNGYNALKYNEGYNDGKAEGGGSCNLGELNVEFRNSDGNGNCWWYANENGVDGFDYVIVNASAYGQEKYDEGYYDGKAEGGSCNYQDYRELVLRAKVEDADFIDENTFWNKSKIIKFDEYTAYTADTIMFIDSDSETWRGNYVTIVTQSYSNKIMLKEGLFSNLEDIYELEITCDTIDENAFNGCANLTKLVLPYAPNINENAFKGCTNLKEIEVEYIKNIAPSAFDGCPTSGIIKVKDNRFDTSILPSSLSSWKIVYVEDGEDEESLTPSAIENEYNTIALRTENIHDSDIILDRTLLVGNYDTYVENGYISYTQNKNGIVITKKPEFSTPFVSGIENGGLNWNTIEYFYSYTITTFGENMTRDVGSNVREIHLDSPIMNTDGADIVFRSGCFATSNLLNKIVFYKPLKVAVYDNAFEGVSSYGEVIVVGEDNAENRAKYDALMTQLGGEWSLNFVNQL